MSESHGPKVTWLDRNPDPRSRRFLKEKNKGLETFAVEPVESAVLSGGAPGPHKIQGIGAGFIPNNCDQKVIDETIQVSGPDAMAMARRLAKEEVIGPLLVVAIPNSSSLIMAMSIPNPSSLIMAMSIPNPSSLIMAMSIPNSMMAIARAALPLRDQKSSKPQNLHPLSPLLGWGSFLSSAP